MVKVKDIYVTTTTISTVEIGVVIDKGQRLLADLAIKNGYEIQLGEKITCVCLKLELYLMLVAIQSWDASPGAKNFFDQNALIKLLSKVEQLFYLCKFKPAC